jgi:hypothetical protein
MLLPAQAQFTGSKFAPLELSFGPHLLLHIDK